jgi:hypothetical protein
MRRISGYTLRQKQLIDSLLDTDDEELFDEGFHKRLLIELVSFMHDWHLRTTARRFQDGDIPSALLWLQDATGVVAAVRPELGEEVVHRLQLSLEELRVSLIPVKGGCGELPLGHGDGDLRIATLTEGADGALLSDHHLLTTEELSGELLAAGGGGVLNGGGHGGCCC